MQIMKTYNCYFIHIFPKAFLSNQYWGFMMVDLCIFFEIFYSFLITFAGFPAITQLSSNFPATTAPAPTTQPSPSTVPFRIMLLHPMKQFLPILISLLGTRSLSPPFSSRRSLFLTSASIGWKSLSRILQLPPMQVFSPIVIFFRA